MDLTSLLVQIVAGAIGGSAAGAAAKQYSLGTLGNAIAGAIGGGIVGQLIGAVAGTAVEGWVGNFAGGAVGGAILMALVGLIKSATQNRPNSAGTVLRPDTLKHNARPLDRQRGEARRRPQVKTLRAAGCCWMR